MGSLTGLIAVVFAQLLYPAGTALPLAKIGESSVGGQTFQEVAETIRQGYANVQLKIEVPNKKPFETTTASAGIVPGYRHAAETVTDYSLKARLVPFSFVYKMMKTPAVGYEIDQENFNTFYEKFAEYCAIPPKDASLVFAKGTVTIDSAKNGQSCTKDAIKQAVTDISLSKTLIGMSAPVTVVEPEQTDTDLRTQFANAKATVEAGLTIRSTKDNWTIPPETVASWMTTVTVDGYVALDVKMDLVKSYIETLRGALYVEPGTTKVIYHDGVEQSRVVGSKGQGIDLDVSAERVKTVLLGPSAAQRIAWVQLTVLEPRLVAEWSFSPSERGLQALLEQWDRSHPARYGLLVRDLGGKGMNAELNADRDFVTASTFKAFLAYAVVHKVETGELSMDSQTDMGLSVRACIDEMILHSTNACALSLFNLAGWDYVHSFIKGQFPSTSLKNSASADNEKHTTVRDLSTFFIKLEARQLVNDDHSNYLLDLFRRQVYRSGIPKGVPGVTVANKVGFYNGFKHDVGLIYATRGMYVLGYMSFGGNDSEISDLSRQVYALLSR